MGFTTKTALREIMRCTILVLSLAIIYATASPMAEDHIIPEESLFALDDDLSEAQQKVNEMTAAGKSDKDCRKLVTETRKDIETNVTPAKRSWTLSPMARSALAAARLVSRLPQRPRIRPTSTTSTPSPRSPRLPVRLSTSAPGLSAP